MPKRIDGGRRCGLRNAGFTLIELLVVVAILALLISILLPSLSKARAQAKAVVCGNNLHQVGLAVASYTSEYGSYPFSYAYISTAGGGYNPQTQGSLDSSKPYGYMHWSWFLYHSGKAGVEAFQCPEFSKGGCPRTFPGPNGENWEGGQVDDHGRTGSGPIEDKQAPRVAYTANAAVIPRNKFTSEASGGPRVNKWVKDNVINKAGRTILATEFLNSWKAIGEAKGNAVLSKSHRPINPFYHLGYGTDEYKAPPNNASFVYGEPGVPNMGVRPLSQVINKVNVIGGNAGLELNAVGRHHPGGSDKQLGGTANFLFCDGHVERTTLLRTLQLRQWGDRYYSLTGANEIMKNTNP